MQLQSMHQSLTSLLEELAVGCEALLDLSRIDTKLAGIVAPAPFKWLPLPTEGLRLRSRLKARYRQFESLLSATLVDESASLQHRTLDYKGTLFKSIDQSESTAHTIDTARAATRTAVAMIRAALETMAAGDNPETILFPDTNALYAEPALEDWAFPDCPRFVLTIAPTVITELDDHKGRHRNKVVREKAARLIRQLEEYRRRGFLTEGVLLRKGRSQLRCLALAPDVTRALGWMKPDNHDDQILASAIEVARGRMASSIGIVTLDTHLRNKCELARIAALKPPTSQSANRRKA